MKTLLVLRHAKSSWSEPSLEDHDRPLKKRGRRDAPRMGALVLSAALMPELIVTSTARRARETALAVAEACGYRGVVRLERRLYEAAPGALLEVVQGLPDELERVMIVGHNPTLELLVTILTGRSETMPTAALAHVALPVQRWSQTAAAGTAELRNLWRPKELV